MKTYPCIVLRFNGDRATERTLVREATSRRTISQRARWAAKAPDNGWCPVLVGTSAALQEVGAYVNHYGAWIWSDDGGFQIAVEEVQP